MPKYVQPVEAQDFAPLPPAPLCHLCGRAAIIATPNGRRWLCARHDRVVAGCAWALTVLRVEARFGRGEQP